MGGALAEAPPPCSCDVPRSGRPQRRQDPPITSRDCQGPLQERIQWVGPEVGHSTEEPEDWGRSAGTWAQPGTRVPTGSLREGPQFYPGKNGEAEATAGKRLLGRAANPESTQTRGATGSPGPDRARLSAAAVPPLRIGLMLRAGVGVGIVHTRLGAGPLRPRPGPIGCGGRGGARLPDVGAVAAAAAGATESEEPPDKIEGEGAAGRPARPRPHRSRWSSQRNWQARRGLRHGHAQHSA